MQYPAAERISWQEWLAFGVIAITPFALAAIGVWLLVRALKG